MSSVRGVSRFICEHGFNGRDERRDLHEPGKNRAVSDGVLNDESRTLRHAQGVKLRGTRTGAGFDLRTYALLAEPNELGLYAVGGRATIGRSVR